MLNYNLVFEKSPINCRPKMNSEGLRYFMKDFFLNFYFQILEGLTQKININREGLLFPLEVIASNSGLYIPNFTGKAFELFVRYFLENRVDWGQSISYSKLNLLDPSYLVSQYWDGDTEIDLIVESQVDRISRIIECKWGQWDSRWITELRNKKYIPPKGFRIEKYLVISDDEVERRSKTQSDVTILGLSDFYRHK